MTPFLLLARLSRPGIRRGWVWLLWCWLFIARWELERAQQTACWVEFALAAAAPTAARRYMARANYYLDRSAQAFVIVREILRVREAL